MEKPTNLFLVTGPKNIWHSCFFAQNENPDFQICETYFRITDFDLLRCLKNFSRVKGNCGTQIFRDTISLELKDKNKINRQKKIIRLFRDSSLIQIIKDLAWNTNVWQTKKLNEWISDFNPDWIFFVGGSHTFSHKIARWISKSYQTPLAVYFTDDYILNSNIYGLFSYIQHLRTLGTYRKTVFMAKRRFVIGNMMANDYRKFFNREFKSIMNCVEETTRITRFVNLAKKNRVFTISYLGGLHFDRWKSIIELGQLLREIQIEHSLSVHLQIFSLSDLPKKSVNELNMPPLYFMGGLTAKEVQEQMAKSDMLLHIESTLTNNRRSTKYSISTKIPEYLSSGKCILGYGPHEVASIKILAENEIAIVLTDKDSRERKKQVLTETIRDEEIRINTSIRGLEYATENFSAAKMRSFLLKELSA